MASFEDLDSTMPIITVEGISTRGMLDKVTGDDASAQQLKRFASLSNSDFIDQFKDLDIQEILLTYATDHQQFVGVDHAKTAIPFAEHGLNTLKAEMESLQARVLGFNKNNLGGPYIFALDHMYASTAQEQLNIKRLIQILMQTLSAPVKVCDAIMEFI